MKYKSFFFIFIIFIAGMSIYFIINPSYERSIEAKYYYEIGDYEEAYKIAKEAFEIDTYNKMATTIMTQSKLSLRYVNYIKDAKKYLNEIQDFISTDEINDAQKAKIRTIAKIMIDSYKKLAPSVAVDKKLIKEAEIYREKFKNILQKAYN
jgi:tetratricopeptide (TPR) repeat protein